MPRTLNQLGLFHCGVAALLLFISVSAHAQAHFNGAKALEYAREFVAIGPRWPTGQGHAKAEAFLRAHFQHDQPEEDAFTADTPIGAVNLRNFIVRYPGKKDGVIVLGTHYETNYPLKDIGFVGANDGGIETTPLKCASPNGRPISVTTIMPITVPPMMRR